MVRLVLLRISEALFRYFWLYLIPIVMMTVVAGVVFMLEAPQYYAGGRLYVERQSLLADLTASNTDGSWWATPAQLTINEINELIATQAFVRSVIQKTNLEAEMTKGDEAIDQAFQNYRQSIILRPVGEKLVEFGASNEDPVLAQQLAMATMDAYIQWKINSDYQESVAAQNFFVNLIKPYQEELERARDELQGFLEDYPEPIRGERPIEEQMELSRLQAAVDRAQERVNSAQDNEESARLVLTQSESVIRQTYMVIDSPEIPDKPDRGLRARAMDAMIFVGVGVALSIMGVGLAALLDRGMRFPIDVRHGLNLPVLAMVPGPTRAEMKQRRRLQREARRGMSDGTKREITAKPVPAQSSVEQ